MTTGQKLFSFLMLCLLALAITVSVAFGQTRDSLIYTKVTVQVSHDTTFTQVVTQNITHDSTYTKVDTLKIPIPQVPVTLKGMYTHPNDVTIGNSTSENNYLSWVKAEGANMLNCYARSYLYDETKRTQLAAFVAKAKNIYGIILVTVDVRFTDSRELPGWQAYFAKYGSGISSIEPLTENEPWIKNSSNVYDYANFFYLVRTMGNLSHQYGVKLNYYEGWVGNNYNGLSFSQGPVDSMVKYCDRIFISNYISVSDYYSTSTSLGKWDNRMDKRCNYIAIACPKFNKTVDIVEIISLEQKIWGAGSDFLGSVFACPTTTTNKCHSFYGSTYTDAITYYNQSTPSVLQYTDLVGRTMFYSSYAKKCNH